MRVGIGRSDVASRLYPGFRWGTLFRRLHTATLPAEYAPIGTHLLLNHARAPRAVLANAITALRLAPEWEGVLGFNEFSLATVALKGPPWPGGRGGCDWTDHEDRLTADWMQHHNICVSVDVAGLAIQTVARDCSFHPVRESSTR